MSINYSFPDYRTAAKMESYLLSYEAKLHYLACIEKKILLHGASKSKKNSPVWNYLKEQKAFFKKKKEDLKKEIIRLAKTFKDPGNCMYNDVFSRYGVKEKTNDPLILLEKLEEKILSGKECDPFYDDYLKSRIRLVQVFPEASNEVMKIREDEVLGDEIKRNHVLLTFDDGPIPGNTGRILDILEQFGIKATFFFQGKQVRGYGSAFSRLLKRMMNNGHTIGIHGMSHRALDSPGIKQHEIHEELVIPARLIRGKSGYPVHYFRAPYGRRNLLVLKIADEIGLKHILWNIDSLDWNRNLGNEDVYRRVVYLAHLNDGGIVLFHEFPERTLYLLPRFIRYLKSKGFVFQSVDDYVKKQMGKYVKFMDKWFKIVYDFITKVQFRRG